MSSKAVNVLAPNGRRQNVKVHPDSTILNIIEEVCKKQGFKSEDYDLRHHNKVIDATLPFRFSGLPNNAQLEMIEAKTNRIETEIVLGLQLENGTRLIGNFKPSEILWDVLVNLCPEEKPEEHPVVIYMRQEIYGEKLRTTTLKSIGLSGGRAMLRLIHKKPEDLKIQANVSAALPSKPVEERPYRRVLQKAESPPKDAENIKHTASSPHQQQSQNANNPNASNFLTNFVKREKATSRKESPQKLEEENKMEVELKEEKRNVLDEIVFLGERNALVFSLETSQAIPSEDLPEEFFELTIEDAKKLLRDIKRRRADIENLPLQTSVLRNLESSKNILYTLNRYKKTIIRIQFPDRTVLQGTFLPTETVEDVLNFIKEYLEDKTLDYYVYTTPPKSVLNPDTRLIEANCVPTALVHFGCNLPHTGETRFLRNDLLDKFITSSTASLAASKMRKDATRSHVTVEDTESDSNMELSITEIEEDDVNVGASTSNAPTVSPTSQGPLSKVPKWFKQTK